MTDIVDRLHAHAAVLDVLSDRSGLIDEEIVPDILEASREITELRQVVRRIREECQAMHDRAKQLERGIV